MKTIHPGISVSLERYEATVNGRAKNLPLISAAPDNYGLLGDDSEGGPILFNAGFGNTVSSSQELAGHLVSLTGRPVVIAPVQEAHRAMTHPYSQLTSIYQIGNQAAKNFISNRFGDERETTVAGLSHGSVVSGIFINEYGPHNLWLLAPMGGDIAEIHDQKTLDELAGIENFHERWQASIDAAPTSIKWRLLRKFLGSASVELVDMAKNGEISNMHHSGIGVLREVVLNSRWSTNPDEPTEPRDNLVVLEAFGAGAATDIRQEVARVSHGGKQAVVACGSRDPMFGIAKVRASLYSHPDLDGSTKGLDIFEVDGVIHPHTVRTEPIGQMVTKIIQRSK